MRRARWRRSEHRREPGFVEIVDLDRTVGAIRNVELAAIERFGITDPVQQERLAARWVK